MVLSGFAKMPVEIQHVSNGMQYLFRQVCISFEFKLAFVYYVEVCSKTILTSRTETKN